MYELEEAQGRGRTASSLSAKGDYWRGILEGVPAVMCRLAPDGTVRSINATGEKITGYRREELVGQNWWQIFYPGDEYSQVERLFRDLEEGDVRHYEMQLTRKHGGKRIISWTSINQFDDTGSLREVVGFGIDVTQQRRAEQLMRAQRDLGIALSAETNLTRALETCLDAALRVSEMDCGGIYLVNEQREAELAVQSGLPDEFVESQAHFDDDELRRQLIQEGDPVYLSTHEMAESVRDFIASAEFSVVAILPVRHEGRTIACLNTASYESETITPASQDALEGIAAQIGTAIARIRAEEKLREEREFLRQVMELQERERRLVAYEIHDGLAQQLTGGIMQLQALRLLGDRHCEQADRDLDKLEKLLTEGLAEARSLIAGLRPMILDELGVVAAIDHLIHETIRQENIEIDFVCEEDVDRLVPPLETAVYRVVQEALNNAVRYSQSDSVLVELTVREGWVRVAVEDWGVGFEPSQVQGNRFGLRGIRERARLLGGRAHVDSAPGLGTCISAEFPLLADSLDD